MAITQRVALINEQTIKATSYVQLNVDGKMLSNAVIDTQFINLRPILGDALYQTLLTAVINQNATPTPIPIPDNLYTLLVDYIHPYLTHTVLEELLVAMSYRLSNKGPLKYNDVQAGNLSAEELRDAKQWHANKAISYKQVLIRYLVQEKFIENLDTDKDVTSEGTGWYIAEDKSCGSAVDFPPIPVPPDPPKPDIIDGNGIYIGEDGSTNLGLNPVDATEGELTHQTTVLRRQTNTGTSTVIISEFVVGMSRVDTASGAVAMSNIGPASAEMLVDGADAQNKVSVVENSLTLSSEGPMYKAVTTSTPDGIHTVEITHAGEGVKSRLELTPSDITIQKPGDGYDADITAGDNVIRIGLFEQSGVTTKNLHFNDSSGMTVTDSMDSEGLKYAADYSDNFTDNSLVTKIFVDRKTPFLTPEMFGAVGDGIADDTEPLTTCLSTGQSVLLTRKYRIIDVILLENKQDRNIVFSGNGEIIINRHGYGIFDFKNCQNISITGGKLTGYGIFPDKNYDGGNGGGEKHYVGGTWGFNRNGDVTGRPAFGNGTIGNCGIGILIHDGCKNITVRNVNITGFNYGGVEVGYRGDIPSERSNLSENITVDGCVITDIYNSGVESHSVNGLHIVNCDIKRMGHPDSVDTDITIDPGYGTALSAVSLEAYTSRNVLIDGNHITDCKRKNIDSHSSEALQITNNILKQSFIQGIALTGNSGERSKAVISNNILTDCGIGNILGGIVDGKIGIYALHENTTIVNNQLYNCGMGSAIHTIGDKTSILNNTVESIDATGKDALYKGVYLQLGIDCLVKDNIVIGVFKRGFYFGTNVACVWEGNTIDLSLATTPDYAFFNTSNVTIGKNKMPVLQRVVGNSIEPPVKTLNFLFTYSTATTTATVTPLSGEINIPFTVSGGGSGTAVVLDIGSDVLAKTSSYIQHNTAYDLVNNPQTYTIHTIASSRFISVIISPRNAGNTAALASNSGIMNGVKIFLQVNLGGLI